EVDARLGRVRVVRVWGGFGAGRIVVPALARSQAEGGILQGISYALYEERRLDPQRGAVLTGGLEDYRILGIGDAPEIEVQLDEVKLDGDALRIGARVTVAALAANATVRAHAPGLAAAAGALATPQIRAVATVGGNLLQRARCWYFRHPTIRCFRSGGDDCPA